MVLDIPQVPGATPLGPDDLAGLRLSHVITRADLDAAEESNILAALAWTQRSRRKAILERDFVLALHKRMFGDVWAWAGKWRRQETSIGVDPATIAVRVEALLGDVRYWVEHATYGPDEIAVRLHHQMVLIHPFANGNGRHTRLMADLLRTRVLGGPFTWGSGIDLAAQSEARRRYIAALQLADRGDIAPLLAFARS